MYNAWLDMIRGLIKEKGIEVSDKDDIAILRNSLEENLYKYAQNFRLQVARSDIQLLITPTREGSIKVMPNNAITNTILVDFLGQNSRFGVN